MPLDKGLHVENITYSFVISNHGPVTINEAEVSVLIPYKWSSPDQPIVFLDTSAITLEVIKTLFD